MMRRAPTLCGAPSTAATRGDTSFACRRIGACAARLCCVMTSSASGELCRMGTVRW